MTDSDDPSGTIFTLFYLDIVIMFSVSDRLLPSRSWIGTLAFHTHSVDGF